MDCAQEVSLLRTQLGKVKGVRELTFDPFQGRMTVQFDPAFTTREKIEKAVEQVGMRCEPWHKPASTPDGQSWWTLPSFPVWVSGVSLLAAVAIHVAVTGEFVETLLTHGHSQDMGEGPVGHVHNMPLAALSLYALSAGAGLLQVLPKAWAATRQWRPDMNTLVVVSAAGALVLGEWVEAATLSFLFALSGRLEGWSLERAREAIAKLLRVAPSRAAVQHKDHFHETLVENLREGMVVRVDGGARIPCDGTVIGGESRVDQALITGESVLIPKSPGAHVYAGTVNQEGTLIVRVDRRTGDTVLARMIRMVESSQARRARTEQMIERFAIRYTPAVFALALAVALTGPALAGGAWTAWAYRGMLVLLVACPCALVISTPVTTMAALTSAAREGVLVKGGAFLEEAAHLRVLLTTQPGPAPHGVELVRVDEHADAEARLEFLRAHVIHQPHVGYAGETLHDAEAIKEAPLGISLAGPGSGAVHEAADVVLMRGGLPGIGFLVAHARRARKIIAANIILAVALKMVFIGAAFLGHATLWMAVAADTGATLLVTLNGLRMLRAVKLKT